MFEPWMLAAIDDAGNNGIRDENLNKLERSISEAQISDLDRNTFEIHCRKCDIDPNKFTQEALNELELRLDN